MADDQVKYSDLFESGINAQVKALTEEIEALRDAISAAKNEAQGMKKELSSMGTATREQQQAVSTQAAAIEKLQKQAKDLTEQEAKAVKFLADSLNFMNQNGTKNMNVWKNMTQSMDGFNMSYNQMKETVKVLESALKSLNSEQQRNSEGAKSAAAAVARLKEAMQAFDAQTKTAKSNVEKTSRAYAKLTDEEIQSLNQLKTALQGTAQEQMAAVQSIDIQAKSYNELYQTYNAIKDVLNAMTVAERENTAAGKEMVNRAKEIRDTMNNLQQQTGNYTLNVGNYMSAMNGLQMQTQQILREIPSAQNLSQFFLAISNNIPMFTDALARYNKGLPEIKAKLAAVTAEITRQEAALAGMNAQSTEYAAKQAQINELRRQEQQLQSASVGGWRAILKSVGSWQTLLIAGLLLLRKIPDIVKWIKERWDRWINGVKEVRNEVDGLTASIRLQADAIKKYASTAAQLDLIITKMSEINQESEQWATGVNMINSLIGESKAKADDNLATLKEITDEYKKQAKQIAINNVLGEMYEQNIRNEMLRKQGYNIYGKYKNASEMATAAAQLYGISLDSKEYKNLETLYEDQIKATNEYYKAKNKGYDAVRKSSGAASVVGAVESDKEVKERITKAKKDAEQAVTNFINKYTEMYTEQELQELAKKEFDLVDPLKTPTTPKGPKKKKPKDQVADLLTLQRQLEDAQTANIEDEYARLEQAEIQRHKRFIEDRQAELKLLSADDPRREIINKQIEEEAETHSNKMFEIAEKRRQELIKQSEEEEKAREKTAKDGAKAELKAAVDGWAQYKAKMVEEGKTRKQIVEAEVAAEIARLNLMLKLNRDVNGEIMSDEQKTKVQEWINLLERLQQTGNYGDYKPGQFMGKGGANVTNERKNYANIWEVLGIDMDNNQVSALNSVFDQAKEALNSWMDARKAAADQAKELADDEVSAAENALNREIELRNQGYANDVALREKELADAKEAQKKAAEEQKKVAQEQVLLDAALQTSSMITASANIIKQFPNPLAWAPMLALMWGTFAYAKTKAYQASTKSIKFKEGGVMLLEGGSHESGHDVNLGIGPDGSNLRAEGGEYFAVINKRSSRKYGSQIPAVVNALNSGMFEDRYIKTSDAVGLLPQVIRADNGTAVDLSSLEGGVDALVKQGESRWSTEGEWRVMRYKNLTRRVRIS